MISLQNTDAIIAVTLSFFTFVFSITLSGTMQAYVARLMGDDTASNLGFADFNPFIHIGFLDLLYFILVDVMLGNLIPINMLEVKRTRRPLRLTMIFGARTITHLTLAIVSGFLMLVINASIIPASLPIDPTQLLVNMRTQLPAHLYILSSLCASMTFANIFLSVFALLRDTIYGVLLCKYEKDPSFVSYINPIMIFGFLLLWIFFARQILMFIGGFVSMAVSMCGSLCGM